MLEDRSVNGGSIPENQSYLPLTDMPENWLVIAAM